MKSSQRATGVGTGPGPELPQNVSSSTGLRPVRLGGDADSPGIWTVLGERALALILGLDTRIVRRYLDTSEIQARSTGSKLCVNPEFN